MNTELQRWLALGVVAIAAAWLAWRCWSRRGRTHQGCDCPGARRNPDLARLKRIVRRHK